jgi:hypothetical protein
VQKISCAEDEEEEKVMTMETKPDDGGIRPTHMPMPMPMPMPRPRPPLVPSDAVQMAISILLRISNDVQEGIAALQRLGGGAGPFPPIPVPDGPPVPVPDRPVTPIVDVHRGT